MKNPTFTLPACPMCSSLVSLERPYWRAAVNTSVARKKACYILVGCNHAVPPAQDAKIRDDPEEWSLVEEDWALESAALLAARTEGWGAAATERFCRELGVPVPKISPPEDPAQQQPKTETENHGQEK